MPSFRLGLQAAKSRFSQPLKRLGPVGAKGLLSLLVLLCVVAMPWPVLAQDDADEVEYLELATVLIRDGNYDRGIAALDQVDTTVEDFEFDRYHTLYGLVYLNRSQLEQAVEAFNAAIAAGQTDPTIQLYLAQAHFGLEEWSQAIESLDQAGEAAARISAAHVMRAQALWNLQRYDAAFAALDNAQDRFPSNTRFSQRKVFYLIELGLYQEAAQLGLTYLASVEGAEGDYVAIGNALRQAKQYDEALRFLEAARLKFPESEDVTKVLAHTYIDMDRMLAAAELMYQLALLEPKYLPESAELFRRADRLYRAMSINQRVADQPTKLKQRLAILVGLEDYRLVTAMEEALYRNGLLNDEDLRYALAYAYFKTNQFADAERHLAKLTKPDLFRKATELRAAITACEEEPHRCIG